MTSIMERIAEAETRADAILEEANRTARELVAKERTDADEAIAAARATFGDITVLSRKEQPANEIAFVTPEDTERALRTKLDTLHSVKPLSVLRIADC